GTVTGILSLPYIGYATRVWLLIAICFMLGYTLSTVVNTVANTVAGAIGALWGVFTEGRHPYEHQVAPWRDQTWRAAYISRFGPEAPKNLTLVLPSNAAELLRLSQPLPPGLAEQRRLAEQITLQINSELTAAIDAITNDTKWRMCYERMKFKVLFEGPLEPIQEVFGRLDSDFSLASAVLIAGAVLSAQFRVWWLMVPATAWIVLGVLRFCVRAYQIAEPWNTLSAQIEMLKSGRE
ncbi:MAG TPA: hypothetical protein VMW15_16010, partial [Terracidiphilus sp.]|nr:hypothetical protein [Terracidiphilus sp.]